MYINPPTIPQQDRKREFKFQRKTLPPKTPLEKLNQITQDQEVVQIDWPRELRPILASFSKNKEFQAVVDKVKAFILAENFRHILENYCESTEGD